MSWVVSTHTSVASGGRGTLDLLVVSCAKEGRVGKDIRVGSGLICRKTGLRVESFRVDYGACCRGSLDDRRVCVKRFSGVWGWGLGTTSKE